MRSGSSLRRYSASRSSARFRGPPVSRTADKGNGCAISAIALVTGAAKPACVARNHIASALIKTANEEVGNGTGIYQFNGRTMAMHILQIHSGLFKFINTKR